MKNRVFMGLAAGLALALISGAALAEVKTTGTVWMRSGPSLNDTQVTSVREGKTLEYLGESREDERGVAWYKVSDGKNTGWISSKYAELTGEDAAVAPAATEEPEDEDNDEADAPAARPALDVGLLFATGDSGKEEAGDKAPEALPGKAVELSGYYLNNLVDTANELGVISYRQVESEVPYQYYNEAVILAGNQGLEGIVVYGPGYEVYGAAVGMDVNAARAALNAAGLDFVSDGNGHVTFEHKAGEDAAYADENGHDSCITLWVDEDGTVTEIDWSTYTG